jgi:hypothetical protein
MEKKNFQGKQLAFQPDVLTNLSVGNFLNLCTASKESLEKCRTDERVQLSFLRVLRNNLRYHVNVIGPEMEEIYQVTIYEIDPKNPRNTLTTIQFSFTNEEEIKTLIDALKAFAQQDLPSDGQRSYLESEFLDAYINSRNQFTIAVIIEDDDKVNLAVTFPLPLLIRLLESIVEEIPKEEVFFPFYFVYRDGTVAVFTFDEIYRLFGQKFTEGWFQELLNDYYIIS